jgi:hypothetical protein
MRITHALLGEHGAMHPLLDLIERTASTADLADPKTQARFVEATLSSHADIEDALLRPAILSYLPKPAPGPDGAIPPTDHQLINAGLASVVPESRWPALAGLRPDACGQFWAMRDGSYGKYGTPGNGESASYRFY